jgi:dTMP kinase
VVCDRFADSTRVYQGALGKVDPRIVRGLERVTVGDAIPDLTVILDLAAELGLQRTRSRNAGGDGDRFEQEGLDFHKQLRAAYREIAAREPGRCILIDASAPEDKVADEVWNAVRRRLGSAPAALAAGAAP